MSHFTALYKKGCLQQILIFLWICSFSNFLRKTNLLTISVLLSEIVIFLTKKRIFQWITQKCFKTTEKHCLLVCGSFWGDFFIKLAHKCFETTGKYNLAVCDSFCWEKQFLLILVPFYCFVKKGLFTTNPNYPLDLLLFKLVEKNKLSDYFNASFWDSHLFD